MGYSKTWLYISTANQQLRHRRVKHFGYEFLYGTNNVDKSNPLNDGIPSVCDVILERIQQHVAFRPDQMTVNEYKPGQGRKNLLTLILSVHVLHTPLHTPLSLHSVPTLPVFCSFSGLRSVAAFPTQSWLQFTQLKW